mmetsp:Transcript_17541/g.44118  ORF Transcript_17541/g.44118 Transcript_17541/m.44118 type:complete len:771 (-) Transcript_17541:106-2418(-)
MARVTGAMLLLGLLACGALATELEAREASVESAWSKVLMPPAAEAKERVNPVKRVVNLLNKMKSELEAEADNEAEMYDKMVCWCETNEKEKTKAVADAEAVDIELSSEIEARAARFGELGTNIAQLKKEIQANSETLDRAVAIRQGEAAKFRETETDMVTSITNLKNAVQVLSKHQSFVQLDSSILSGLRVLLRDTALRYDLMVAGRDERQGPSHVALLAVDMQTARYEKDGDQASAALLQALNIHSGHVSDALPLNLAARVIARAASGPKSAFLQQKQPAPFESRSSGRSSEIFGVLQQMQKDFENELTTEQQEELKAQEDFKALAAAKTEEIDFGKRKLDEMEVEHANNQKALSDANENLGLTRQQRSGDVEFLRNLKLTCNDLDDQWEKRSKTRGAETVAVAEAIAILTEDDNREHLAATVSFIQERSISASASALRLNAAAALRRAAQAPDFDADDLLNAWNGRAVPSAVGAAAGPRTQLATLATAVQLDAFAKVKELMDKMMADLKDQQAEEVTFKDHCGSEMDSTETTLYEKGELKKDLQSNIERLESLMKKLDEEIEASKVQISGAQIEVKKAGQQREQENKEFQSVVADQRATQGILKKALIKLEDFYKKGIGKALLLQRSAQTPPVQFGDYKSSAGASPVIGLIKQILEDSAKLETEAMDSESSAQADYEGFVKDSNELAKGLAQAIISKSDASASAKTETAQAAEDLDSTKGELGSLSAYEADLHEQCDWSLKNFDIRQKARAQEMEAIAKAKAFLSGMK